MRDGGNREETDRAYFPTTPSPSAVTALRERFSATSRKRCDRISVLIPTHNEGDNLRRTIDSLRANTFYPDVEVLIQDDASDDGSCDFLHTTSYASDPRLRLIRYEERKGLLYLRRDGVARASGSVLQFLDAHMTFTPYWLSNLYLSLARRGFRAIVGAPISKLDATTWQRTASLCFGYTWDAAFHAIRPLRPGEAGPDGWVPWLGTGQMMLPRRLYDDVGGFGPWFQGHGTWDQDFCLRAFLLGYECHIEPSVVLGHRYKSTFINPVTWRDLALNYFILIYLNLGPEAFERLQRTPPYGREAGLEAFDALRPELDRFRQYLVERQRRSSEELLARLPGLETAAVA